GRTCWPSAPAAALASERAVVSGRTGSTTIARSLAIGAPADGPYVLDVVRKTNGAIEMVTDEEVVEGIRLLAETEGIFAETAGGVTIGCLKKLVESGFIRRDEETVAIISGGGLKTVEAVKDHVAAPLHVDARASSFVDALEARGREPVSA